MRYRKLLFCLLLAVLLPACQTVPASTTESSQKDTVIATPGLQYLASVTIGSRTATYERVDLNVPELGDLYLQSEEADWYLPADSDDLKYLIRQGAESSSTLWAFLAFEAPPYTYGEVLETIYNVHSAEDIDSITTHPAQDDNTPEGRLQQEEVGTHTYDAREDITAFYNIIKDVQCLGLDSGTGADIARFEDGSITYDRRWLTVTLADGTTIDNWKYDAGPGAFYEFNGIGTVPLSDEDAQTLRTLFHIQ